MTDHPQAPNRGGAPRGNTNALKHGYYATTLQRRVLAAIREDTDFVDFVLVEGFIAHLLHRIEKQVGDLLFDPREVAAGHGPDGMQLRLLTLALYILAHLLHKRGIVTGAVNDPVETALAAVLDQLPLRELNGGR